MNVKNDISFLIGYTLNNTHVTAYFVLFFVQLSVNHCSLYTYADKCVCTHHNSLSGAICIDIKRSCKVVNLNYSLTKHPTVLGPILSAIYN